MRNVMFALMTAALLLATGTAHSQGCNPYAQYPSSSVYAGGIGGGPPASCRDPARGLGPSTLTRGQGAPTHNTEGTA